MTLAPPRQVGEAIESIPALVENAQDTGFGMSEAVAQQHRATSQKISLVTEQTESVSKTIHYIIADIRQNLDKGER